MTSSNSINTLLFVDRNVENYQSLIANTQTGTEIILLDANQDGVEQITNVLAQRSNIASVQIISHGSEGQVQLGSTLLNTETIAKYHHLLEQWRNSLTENADILLFGCDVASGIGEEFLQQLSEITGADIAGSTDITGNANLGGDWNLEVQTGSIESSLAVTEEAKQGYTDLLYLKAEYFNDKDLDQDPGLSDSKGTRYDIDNINYAQNDENFDFVNGNNDRGIIWTGYVYAPDSGNYTFYADIDDGVRLWVNNTRIIDKWNNGTGEYTGNISLTGGQWYPFQMNFQNNTGGWRAILKWSSSSISKQVIPAANFILPNDIPSTKYPVSITPSTLQVTEGGTARLTIKSDLTVSGEVKVFYKVEPISGADSKDLNNVPQTQYIAKYVTLSGSSATINIPITDDLLTGESGEKVRITLLPDPSNAYSIKTASSSATVTINDNEPVIGIEKITTDGSENIIEEKFTFSLTLDRAASQPFTVNFIVSGSAKITDDYTFSTSRIIKPSDGTKITISIPIKNDDIREGDESFTISLKKPNSDDGYTINSSKSSIDFNLIDDEPKIGITKIKDGSENIGDNAEFELTFDRQRTEDFALKLNVDAVTKKDASDPNKYLKITGSQIIRGDYIDTAKGADYLLYWRYKDGSKKEYIAADQFTVTANTGLGDKAIIIGVEPINDEVAENTESVKVELVQQTSGSNKRYYEVDSNNKSDTIYIDDNEPTLEFVTFKNAKEYDTFLPNGEDSGTIGYIELKADKPVLSSLGLWVKYTITAGNTVIEGVDYLSSQYRKVSFNPSTQTKGIIVPNSEDLKIAGNSVVDASKIRIYFMALPDAIKENTENLDIKIQPYHFDLDTTGNKTISNYFLKQNGVIVDAINATLKIEDSGLYSPQVLIIDQTGQLVSDKNPLAVTDGKATLKLKLGSQPLNDVIVKFNPPAPTTSASLPTGTITKNEGIDNNDKLVNAIAITTSSFRFDGAISSNKDIDTFKIDLKPGDKLKIDIDARKPKLSTLDSQINLLNSKGEIVAKNDDTSGDDWDSLLEYTVSKADTYYIQVVYSEYYGASGTTYSSGKYKLAVDVTPVNVALKPGNNITFNATNWDKLQTINIEGVTADFNLQAQLTSSDANYQNLNLSLPVTITPPLQTIVKEGVATQNLGTPKVSIFAVGDPSLSNKDPQIQENSLEAAQFVVQLDHVVDQDLTISYSIGGTATKDIDYSGKFSTGANNTYSVTIPKGEISVALPVVPIADNIKELSEEITITLNSGNSYNVDANANSKTITLIDSNIVGFKLANVSFDDTNLDAQGKPKAIIASTFRALQTKESGEKETFAIRLKTKPNSNVTVDFKGFNSKESSLSTSTVTFTPDNWDQYQLVEVKGEADTVIDGDITYDIPGKSSSNDSNYNGLDIPITVTNQDINNSIDKLVTLERPNPSLPLVTIQGTNTTFAENSTAFNTVKVILDRPAPQGGLPVFFSFDGSSATWKQDFTVNTNYFQNQTQNQTQTQAQTQAKNLFNSINVGKFSNPNFADLDKDGDLDLVVGNGNGVVQFYRNIGTTATPFFSAETGSSNPFTAIKVDGNSTPTFADIDQDGDLDLVIGSSTGNLSYSENISDSKGIKFAPLQKLEIIGQPTITNSAPTFADIDRDGDLDAIIGAGDGTIKYYLNTGTKNTGTSIQPILTPQADANNPFKGIDVGDDSKPNLVDFDGDGDLDLFVGGKNGKVSFYRNIGTAKNPQFTLDNNTPTNSWNTGANSAPLFIDLDQDNDLDAVLGKADGTLQYQKQYQAIVIPEGQTTGEITVQAIDDQILEGNEIINLKLAEDTSYRVNTNQPENHRLPLTIQDNDKAGLLLKNSQGQPVSSLKYQTQENSNTPVNFSLELTSKPTNQVKVSVFSQNVREGLLQKTGDTTANQVVDLIFTPDNWNQPQSFSIIPQDDRVQDGAIAYIIGHQVQSLDPNYNDTADSKLGFNISDRLVDRVSIAADGTQANNYTNFFDSPAISADGRYVIFSSFANNLVANDSNGNSDVFIYDRNTKETERLSVSSDGIQGNNYSYQASISTDGRYVVFTSAASNLVSGDTNSNRDIFIYDRTTQATQRLNLSNNGTQANADSYNSAINADGRYVVFESDADNLVAGDINSQRDIFVRDRTTNETQRINLSNSNQQANNNSYNPVITADGRYIIFESDADNLVAGDNNGKRDIFIYDRTTTRTIVNKVITNPINTTGGTISVSSTISPTGEEQDKAFDNDTNTKWLIFGSSGWIQYQYPVSNVVVNSYSITSANDFSERDPKDWQLRGSNDGSNFETIDKQTGINFNNRLETKTFQVNNSKQYRYYRLEILSNHGIDAKSGGAIQLAEFKLNANTATTVTESVITAGEGIQRISVASDGTQANGNSAIASVSADGRYIVFESEASNLVAGDTNGKKDIFIYDRTTKQTQRISVSSDGTQGNGDSLDPTISGDGRYVVFESEASNLVANDTNSKKDIFRYDRTTKQIERLNIANNNAQGTNISFDAAISGDGSYVVFGSLAENLVAGDSNKFSDIFVSAPTKDLVVTNLDDNDKAGFVITSLPITTEGTQDAFSIKLASQPTGKVVVTLTPQDDEFYFVGKKPGDTITITFNAQNWDKAQTLQIAAVDDNKVEYLQRSAIAFEVSGEDPLYNNIGANLKPVTVLIQDNDLPTASISAGRSAAEIYSTPGYFVVQLDRNLGEQGTLVLDGVDDYVSLGDPKIGGDFTLEAWIKIDKYQNNATIIDLGNGQDKDNILLQVDTTGKLQLNTRNGSGNQTTITTNQVLAINQWIHVAAVNDGKGNAAIYLNGELATQASGQTIINNITRNSNFIGKSNWSNEYFDGNISEVRVWDTARSSDQIRQNMNRFLSGTENGLKTYYSINNANPTNLYPETLTDYTNNGIDGTLKNGATWQVGNFDAPVYALPVDNTGLEINYKITGGTATKDADYQSIGTDGNNIGKVRVFGNQILIPIVPIDDKKIEDVSFTINNVSTVSSSNGKTILRLDVLAKSLKPESTSSLDLPTASIVDFGNGLTGNLNKNVTLTQLAQGSFSFDGTNNYASFGNTNIGGDFTIEAWIKIDKHQNYATIIDLGNGQDKDNILLQFDGTTGKLELNTRNGSGTSNRTFITTDKVLPIGQWIHIAAVNDGKGNAFIYLNGELIKQASGQQIVNNITRSSNFIGKSNWSDEYFDGNIAEVRVWDTARSTEEIQANMNRFLSGKEDGLDLYYSANTANANATNKTSGVINDLTGNGINATLQNGATWNVSKTDSPVNSTVINYTGTLELTVDNAIASQIKAGNAARIPSETVTVTLLPGDGYKLGDTNSKTASLNIIDNDVPGVRIVQGGNRTIAIEDDSFKTNNGDTLRTSQFELSLLSEPSSDVTLTLTTNTTKKNAAGEDKKQLRFIDKNGQLVDTLQVTFKPEEWYKLKTITVQGIDDGILEPNLETNIAVIDYKLSSKDINYDNLAVVPQTVYIVDRVLDKVETIKGIEAGFGTLQGTIDNLELPIIGSLKGRSPTLLQDLGSIVIKGVSQTDPNQLTTTSLEKLIEDALTQLGIPGVDVKTTMTDIDVYFEFNAKKNYELFNLNLSSDLGVPALGIGFETQGNLTGNFNYDLSVGFGLNKLLGFYINPDKTKFHADVSLNLSQNFKGVGNLGFLQVDFANDPNNLTKLGISADISFKDPDASKKKLVAPKPITTIDVTAIKVDSTPADTLVIPTPPQLPSAPTEKLAPKSPAATTPNLPTPVSKSNPSQEIAEIPVANPVLAQTVDTKTVEYNRNLQTIPQAASFTSSFSNVSASTLATWLKNPATATAGISQEVLTALTNASPEVKVLLQILLAETTGVNIAFNDKQLQFTYLGSIDFAKLANVIPGVKNIPLNGLTLPVTGAKLTINNPGLENADYTFSAASLPKAQLVSWLSNQAKTLLPQGVQDVLNSLLTLTNNVDLVLGRDQLQITYLGNLDIAQIKDKIPGIKDLPLTGLTLPVTNPTITITNPGNASANYALSAASLPKAQLVSWLGNQAKTLLPQGVQDVVNKLLALTNNVDLVLGKEQIQIAYQGNLNLTQLTGVIPGIKDLPLTGLNLPVTNPKITITNPGSVNADYAFVAEKLPKAQLVSWLAAGKSSLPQGVQDVLNKLLALTNNIDLVLGDNQIEVAYQGNLDLAQLAALIPGVKELPLNGLTLPVTNPRLTINNPKGTNPDYAFAVDSLPKRPILNWITNQAKSVLPEAAQNLLNQLFIENFERVDLVLGSKQMQITYKGDLQLDKLISAIPGVRDLPLTGLNLPVTNPSLTLLNLGTPNVDYAFSVERLPKQELINWVKGQAAALLPEEVRNVLNGLLNLTENVDLQLGNNQIQIGYLGKLDLSSILQQVPGLKDLPLNTLKLPVTNPRLTIINPNSQDIDYSFAVEQLPKQELVNWLVQQLPTEAKSILNTVSDVAQQVDVLFSDKQLKLAYQGNLDIAKIAKVIPGIKDLSLDGLALPVSNPQLILSNLGTQDLSYAFKSDRLPKKELVTWLTNTVTKLLPADVQSFVKQLLSVVENIDVQFGNNQIQIGYLGDLNLKTIIDGITSQLGNFLLPLKGLNLTLTNPSITITNPNVAPSFSFNLDRLPVAQIKTWLVDQVKTLVNDASVQDFLTGLLNNLTNIDLVLGDNQTQITYLGSVDLVKALDIIPGLDSVTPKNLSLPVLNPSFTINKTGSDRNYSLTAESLPKDELTQWLSKEVMALLPTEVAGMVKSLLNVAQRMDATIGSNQLTLSYQGNLDLATIIKEIPGLNELPLNNLSLPVLNPKIEILNPGKNASYNFSAEQLPKQQLLNWLVQQLPAEVKSVLQAIANEAQNLDVVLGNSQIEIGYNGNIDLVKLLALIPGVKDLLTTGLSLPVLNPKLTILNPGANASYSIDAEKLPKQQLINWLSSQLPSDVQTVLSKLSTNLDINIAQNQLQLNYRGDVDLLELAGVIPGVKDLPLQGLKLNVTNPSFTLINPGKANADYIFNSDRLPTKDLLAWLKTTATNSLPDAVKSVLNQLLALGTNIDLVLGKGQMQLAYNGNLDLAQVIGLIPGVKDIGALSGLNLPVTNPSITILNPGTATAQYLLKSDRLPKEELVSWAKGKATELLPADLVKVFNTLMNISEGIDLEVGNNQLEIAYEGSVDLATLLKEIPGLNELPLNNLKLPVLNPSLTITNPGKSASYSFAATKLPKQELISWLKEQAKSLIPTELQGIFNALAAVGEQLDIRFGDSQFQVKYQGNLNLVNILKEIPGIKDFDFTGLTLNVKNPSITITNPGKDADFSFNAEKLPIAELQNWLITKAGNALPTEAKDILNGLKNLAQDVNILLTDKQIQVLYDGTVDVVGLIKNIPGISNIPLPPNNALTVTKPTLTLTRVTTNNITSTDFNFSVEKLNKKGLTAWLIPETKAVLPSSVSNVISSLIATAADFEVLFKKNQLQISYPGTLDLASVIKQIPGLSELQTTDLTLPITNPVLSISNLDQGAADANYSLTADHLPKQELVDWLTKQAKAVLPGEVLNVVEDLLDLARRVDLQIGDSQIQITYEGILDLSDVLEKIPGLDALNVNTLDLPVTNPSLTLTKPLNATSWRDANFTFKADQLPTKQLADWLISQGSALVPSSVATPVKDLLTAFGNVNIGLSNNQFQFSSNQINLSQVINAIPGINSIFTAPPNLTLRDPNLLLTNFKSGTTSYQFSASDLNLATLATSLGIPDDLSSKLPKVNFFVSNDKVQFSASEGIDLKSLVSLDGLGLPDVITTYIKEIKIDNPQITVTKAANSANKIIDLSGTVAGLNIGLNYDGNKWISKGIDDGGRLSALDLINIFNTAKTNQQGFYNFIDYQLKGEANLGLTAKTSINGSPVFPSFSFDVAANFPIFNYGNVQQANKNGTNIKLNNVAIDLGSFISNLMGPVIKEVNQIIEPIKPVIKLLNADTKLFTQLGLGDLFDANSDGKVTVFEVAKRLAPPEDRAKLEKSERFIKAVGDIVDLITELSKIPANQPIVIDLGSFALNDLKVASKDTTQAANKVDTSSSNTGGLQTTKTATDPLTSATNKTSGSSTGSFLSKLKNIEGLEFPILTNPLKAIDLLLGKTTDLVIYDVPDLEFNFGISKSFPIWGPVKGELGGSFSAKTNLVVGFDTAGVNDWKNDNFEFSSIYKIFDGFYLKDWDANGKDVDELSLNATITAGLGLDVGVADATVRGGVQGYLGVDVVDTGENTGTSDGKVRGSEIISRISKPWELFDLNGSIDAFLEAEIKVLVVGTVWKEEFARFNLAKFTLSADGFTFSGALSQSYIAGATIFLDTNFNNQWDVGEVKTISDEYGQFNLDIPQEVDTNGDGEIGVDEAQLVGLGGFDTSSGLSSGALIALPGSAIVTPLTSLEARLVQSGLSRDAADGIIKQQLGLDLSSKIESFDPLKAVGEKQEIGLDVYLAHIQVQSLLNQTRAFLDGLQQAVTGVANPNNLLEAINALAVYLQNSTYSRLDLTNIEILKSFFNSVLERNQLTASAEQVSGVALATAAGNEYLETVAKVGASKAVSEALPVLASLKRVTEEHIPVLIQQMAAGKLTTEQLIGAIAATFDQNYYLVDANGNNFGNRYASVSVSPARVSEADATKVQFRIDLTQEAPNQGLKILYDFSGTATLGEDYQIVGATTGEINIAPGETTAVIEIQVLNDNLAENLESIALNLKTVGEGYAIAPNAKVALIDIQDDDQTTTDSATKGIVLKGNLLANTLTGGVGNDQLEGKEGNDYLDGKEGNDFLLGGGSNDTLIGGLGNDQLEGNAGDDSLEGGEGSDRLEGGEGSDRLLGGVGSDIILAGLGDDYLEGNQGNDQLEGGGGKDTIYGNEDNDWIVAGDSNDVIVGGTGDDILNGGAGADVFFFNSPNDGFDTILDFNPEQGDKIQISASGFGVSDLSGFRFINGVLDFQGKNLALIQNQGKTYAYFSHLEKVVEIVDQPTPIPSTENQQIPENLYSFNAPAVLNDLVQSSQGTGANLLEAILQRGYLKVASSSQNSVLSFDLEFVGALAAALFGNKNQVEIVNTTSSDGFTQVANKNLDLSVRRVTENLVRDGGLNVDFGPVYLYDHQGILVPTDGKIQKIEDLKGATIGVVSNSTAYANLVNILQPLGISFTPRWYDNGAQMFAAYEKGEISALSIDTALVDNYLRSFPDPQKHKLLDGEFSKEPIALVLPENESAWADVVRWVTYATIQAEEFGITSQNIDQILKDNQDENPNNDSDPAIRRFLGLQEKLGTALGLRDDFIVQVIKQVGNYGEIYQRHFPNLERDRNLLWTDGGLMYTPPFSGTPKELNLIDNDKRNVLDEIKQRGVLKFGLPEPLNFPGFTVKQADGTVKGFDADLGRALAAAVFGNPNQVEFVQQAFADGFGNTANGVVDASAAAYTENLVRDASYGIDYSPIYLYTGQGILTRKNSGISSIPTLNGRKIGLLSGMSGTTALSNLQDALVKFSASPTLVTFETSAEMYAAYDRGEVEAVFNDVTLLAGKIPTLSQPQEHQILQDTFSKEPLALIIDENQSDWADVVRWTMYTLVQAEEYGINSTNIDELIALNTDADPNNDSTPEILAFLGIKGNLGAKLGLNNDFAVKVIKAVGNAGELYARNFDTNLLPRGLNELYTSSGLQYAAPFGGIEPQQPHITLNTDTKVFQLEGDTDTINLKFSLSSKHLNRQNIHQIALVAYDNAQGEVDGFKPGQDGYLNAVLKRSQVLFSVLPDDFISNPTKIIQRASRENLGLLFFQNTSLDAVINDSSLLNRVFLGSPFGTSSTQVLTVASLDNNQFSLSFEDQLGDIDPDLVVKLEITNEEIPLGGKLQKQGTEELIDLTDLAGLQVQVSFPIVKSEAAYDNVFGFYQIEDIQGSVVDSLTGKLIRVGEAGYAQAAIRNSQQHGMTMNDQGVLTGGTFAGGKFYAPYLIANGTVDAGLKGDVSVYFSFTGANSDHTDHFLSLGNNAWGVEDLAGGGDRDFNDIVIQANFKIV